MLEQMVELLGRQILYTFVSSQTGATRGERVGKAIIGAGHREFTDYIANDRLDVLIPLRFFVDRYDAKENQGYPLPEPGDRITVVNEQGETRLTLVVVTGDDSITYRPSDTLYEVLRVHCRVTGRA